LNSNRKKRANPYICKKRIERMIEARGQSMITNLSRNRGRVLPAILLSSRLDIKSKTDQIDLNLTQHGAIAALHRSF
jgi:hypothetical protein